MPIFGCGKRNRTTAEQVHTFLTVDSKNHSFREQNGLQGWDLVQDTILSHDEDMIADFADDIDTLLVCVSARFLSL